METIAQLQYTFIVLALSVFYASNFYDVELSERTYHILYKAFHVCAVIAIGFTLIRIWGGEA